MQIDIRTPKIVCLNFTKELSDKNKFSWWYAHLDLTDYILYFNSERGAYTIQFPKDKMASASFIEYLSTITLKEFLDLISEFDTFNFQLSVMETCSKIRRLYGEEGLRAIKMIESLEPSDETTFHSSCMKICRCNAIYDPFNVIQIRRGYSGNEVVIGEFFRDMVQPYLRNNLV